MTYQDSVIEGTRKAIDDLFRSARAVPSDRLEWSPMGEGRTVLSLLQECSQTPGWFTPVLKTRQPMVLSKEAMEQGRLERLQRKTIDDCEAACRRSSEDLFAAMREVPEADLEDTITLPFGGGMEVTLRGLMTMTYWNLVYHLGQVNYIQTLYGDKEMH